MLDRRQGLRLSQQCPVLFSSRFPPLCMLLPAFYFEAPMKQAPAHKSICIFDLVYQVQIYLVFWLEMVYRAADETGQSRGALEYGRRGTFGAMISSCRWMRNLTHGGGSVEEQHLGLYETYQRRENEILCRRA